MHMYTSLIVRVCVQESSRWRHYLSLVPNLEESSPPMLWAESERHRLLEGTGLEERVERDLKRIKQDFTELVLPFMQRHPQHFKFVEAVASSPGLQLCGGKAWYRLHVHALDFLYTLP